MRCLSVGLSVRPSRSWIQIYTVLSSALSVFCSRSRLTQPYNPYYHITVFPKFIQPSFESVCCICWCCCFWQAVPYIHNSWCKVKFSKINHCDISYFTNFRLWPLPVYCCFFRYKFTLLSYLLVKILYIAIISPLIRLYFLVSCAHLDFFEIFFYN